MPLVTVQISELDEEAMRVVCESSQAWLANTFKERAQIAIQQIVAVCQAKCLEQGVQIPATQQEMVTLAIKNNWVKTASPAKT